jgi:hypothetical protein
MNEPRTIWQISAGPASRNYEDLFFQYGVALIGPAGPGVWTLDRSDTNYGGGYVRQIANELKAGDVVLLRHGTSRISAVGLVCGDYQFFPQFDDVNGWDLEHGRRVRWNKLPEQYNFGRAVFGANPPRISRVRNVEVTNFVRAFLNSPPTNWHAAPLPSLPIAAIALSDDEIPQELRDLVGQVRDVVPLMWDRTMFPHHPAEDEVVANFAVPLLRALGWHPEHIAIKWRFIDITLFSRLPRVPENSELVIEAKRLGAGVEGALPQARRYVEKLGVPRDVVVTDGIRYRLYEAAKNFAPAAYANLANLKFASLQLFDRMRRSSTIKKQEQERSPIGALV